MRVDIDEKTGVRPSQIVLNAQALSQRVVIVATKTDETLAEDASRIRINPGIMARLRSQALNIARANGVENIAKALWSAALDPEISLSYREM